MNDDYTGLPINVCSICGCEVIGYLDDTGSDFICDDCYKKLGDINATGTENS